VIGEAIKKIPPEIIDRHPVCSLERVCGNAGQDGARVFPDKPDNPMGDEPARSRTACSRGKSAVPGIFLNIS